MEDEKEVIIKENRTLAEENVNKEPEITERKGRVSELAEQGKTLCVAVQSKLAEISEFSDPNFDIDTFLTIRFAQFSFVENRKGDNTPDTALALLQAAAAENEETSDKLVTKLNEKELAIDEFEEQFIAARKTMHLRKLKAEKMIELLREENSNSRGGNGGGGGGYPGGQPYPPSNFYPSGHGVPYPTGPLAMPMPNMPNMMFRHF